MNCAYLVPVEGGHRECGNLARWVVTIDRHRLQLCTIHKLTLVSRNPGAKVELA